MQVAENLDWERFAAVSVRLPELPGVAPTRGFSRIYPAGAAVAHLIGYVGAAIGRAVSRRRTDPLLITPGFKLGKDGLEKTLEDALRGKPGAKRVEVTARGKLVARARDPRPTCPGKTARLTIDAGLAGICRAAARHQFGLGGGDRLPDRRHARDGLDAGLRSQQLLRRDQPSRMEDAVATTITCR